MFYIEQDLPQSGINQCAIQVEIVKGSLPRMQLSHTVKNLE